MSGERPDWMTDDLIDATEEDAWGNRAVPFLLAAHAHTPLVPAARLAEVEAEVERLHKVRVWSNQLIEEIEEQRDDARGRLAEVQAILADGGPVPADPVEQALDVAHDLKIAAARIGGLVADLDRLRDLLRDLMRWLDDPEAAWSDITPLAHRARAALSSVEGEAPAPTPEEDRCETLAGENDNFGRCQFARGHEGDHLSEYGDVFSDAQATPTVEPCPDCDACHGTGRLLGDMRIPCAPCGGAGRRPVEGEENR